MLVLPGTRQGPIPAVLLPHGFGSHTDEVGELPLELRARLLRVLENGEVKHVGASRPFHVDVRVVAATNRDLRAEVRQGRFRQPAS